MIHPGEVITASLQALKNIRGDDIWDGFDISADNPHAAKRKRTISTHLRNTFILSTVGQTDSSTPSQSLKRSLLNFFNRAIGEIGNRFSKRRLDLMKAVICLLPQSTSFLSFALLSPLQLLAENDIATDSVEHEMHVAKSMLYILI